MKYLDPKRYAKRLGMIFRKISNALFGSIEPVSRRFGFGRGQPIDRYYIDRFLADHSGLIKGDVVEVGDLRYCQTYAAPDARCVALNPGGDDPRGDVTADLTKSATLPRDSADCFIATQTFNFIYDVRAAARGAHDILKPGGTMLATVSGISQISRHDMDRWGDYWRFTTLSARKVFEEAFGVGNIEVRSYGNCLTARSFLNGLSSSELTQRQLEHYDADYQVLITIVATKR